MGRTDAEHALRVEAAPPQVGRQLGPRPDDPLRRRALNPQPAPPRRVARPEGGVPTTRSVAAPSTVNLRWSAHPNARARRTIWPVAAPSTLDRRWLRDEAKVVPRRLRGRRAPSTLNPQPSTSIVSALHVLARLRVHGDLVARLHESRDHHRDAVVELRWLEHVGDGVTPRRLLGVLDRQHDTLRHLQADALVVVQQDLVRLAVLHEVDLVADDARVHLDLVVVVGIHEVEDVAVAVEVLEVLRVDVVLLDRLARLEGEVDQAAGADVAQLRPVERGPFAGVHELELGDLPGLVPVDDVHAFLELSGRYLDHSETPRLRGTTARCGSRARR